MTDSETAPTGAQIPLIATDGPSIDGWTRAPFSVTQAPGILTSARGGAPVYPGVRLEATADTVPPQNVFVSLPGGKNLAFVTEGEGPCQLTVQDSAGGTKSYPGSVLPGGQAAVFQGVDLALPKKGAMSAAWVAVTASGDTPLGDTNLTFAMGDQASPSTVVRVVQYIPFSVSPAVTPVPLSRGGKHGYPGVVALAAGSGTVSPQDVYVALPEGKGLAFVNEGSVGDCQLTVLHDKSTYHYPGTLTQDGQAVYFTGVDLHLTNTGPTPTTSSVWVPAKASKDAPLGGANLTFAVGDQASLSARITVQAASAA
ncbi:hypothetical protein [Streptomyces sp. UNOC14_S4]|uniref:hypothetical protein n=1 Tax=Streptomyces sp. UNOC14_S4 TaxID=2872340 RepID=UPI001E4C672B|nr:hypothetical protein [Streptomyces sp. UNOC14_S4]MCC3771602.1 hypothetical protein [Streptomyces sp. UNOC14_S4]